MTGREQAGRNQHEQRQGEGHHRSWFHKVFLGD
jgi:hypothetical protein